MKHKLIKVGFIAISFFAFVLIMNGCKKTGLGEIEQQTNPKEDAAAVAIIKAEIEKNGMSQRVEVNQPMKSMYVDLNGNPATPSSSRNVTSTCGTDANGDPWLPSGSLEYYEKQYQCQVGYKIKWTYLLSWANNIVLVNPFNAANKTKGRARILTPTGVTYDNTNFNAVITDMGENPALPGENLFYVSFTTTTLIPISVLNAPNAKLQLSYFLASDCADLSNYQIGPTDASAYNSTVPLSTNPCNRNDKVYITSGSTAGRVAFAGYDAIGSCQHQFTCDQNDPDFHEVQYSLNGGITWLDMTSNISYPSWISGTRFLPWYSFGGKSQPIPSGTYNIQVRSRNWKYNTCPSNAGLPNATNSCFNPLWRVDIAYGVVVY